MSSNPIPRHPNTVVVTYNSLNRIRRHRSDKKMRLEGEGGKEMIVGCFGNLVSYIVGEETKTGLLVTKGTQGTWRGVGVPIWHDFLLKDLYL